MNIRSIGFSLVLSILLTSVVSAKDGVENSANLFDEVPPSNVDLPLLSGNTPSENTPSTASLLASLKDTKTATKPAVSDGAIGKMFVGLGGVLALIFACSWMLKRFNINKFGMTNSLSISGVLPIGAKEKVVVVDVEGTRLVLGVTATSITKLHTLDVVEEPDPLMKEEKKSPISSDFSEKMKKIMKEGLKSD